MEVEKNNNLHGNADFGCRKLSITTIYGAYRLIVIEDILIDIVLWDIYAKGVQEDLSQQEYKDLKAFYLECKNKNFIKNLPDF